MDIKLTKPGKTKETDTFMLPEDAALAALVSGAAVLAKQQEAPPSIVLDYLRQSLSETDRLGPGISDPKLIAKLSDQLFAHGVRQSAFEGRRVVWLAGRAKLREACWQLLSSSPQATNTLFVQAESTWNWHRHNRIERSFEHPSLTDEQEIEEGFVRVGPNYLSRGTTRYIAPSRHWFVFWQELQAALGELDTVLSHSLRAVQIICGEGLPRGDRLVHPEEAAEAITSPSRRKLFFVFSKDLNLPTFKSEKSGSEIRLEISDWYTRCFEELAKAGKRPSLDQILDEAVRRWGVSRNTAELCWRSVKDKIRAPAGRIPASSRVKVIEIREIK